MELVSSLSVNRYKTARSNFNFNTIFLYSRIDDDRGKSYEVGQSAVKCFRGILRCWLQVADKVEAFKKNQVAQNALYTRYHLRTGQVLTKELDPCMDNHLQVGSS